MNKSQCQEIYTLICSPNAILASFLVKIPNHTKSYQIIQNKRYGCKMDAI